MISCTVSCCFEFEGWIFGPGVIHAIDATRRTAVVKSSTAYVFADRLPGPESMF
jgi:hypothetical protein